MVSQCFVFASLALACGTEEYGSNTWIQAQSLRVKPSLAEMNQEHLSERDHIWRASETSSWAQRNEADVFFAFDTAIKNTQRRTLARRWLAEIKSTSNLTVSHAFFSDGPLGPGEHDFIVQPKQNHLIPGTSIYNGWTERWLFDIKWAVEHVKFSSIIRADDDGFQCGAGLENLLGHLSLTKPLMVGSSDQVPKHEAISSSTRLFYQWNLAEVEDRFLPNFEENWVLLSKPMARSIVDMVAVRPPGHDEPLGFYMQALLQKHTWPPQGSLFADVGRFDNDTSYQACIDPLVDKCAGGINVWESNLHGFKTYEAFAQACRKDRLLWFHTVRI